MTITATDFQLHVNEYFTRLMQGEEIIIERYGKKFAVLVPFTEYEKREAKRNQPAVRQSVEITPKTTLINDENLSPQEVTKLVKRLLS